MPQKDPVLARAIAALPHMQVTATSIEALAAKDLKDALWLLLDINPGLRHLRWATLLFCAAARPHLGI